MRGLVASKNNPLVDVTQSLIENIREDDQLPEVHLDWEDFLQRPDVREQCIHEILRPLFEGDARRLDNSIWSDFESHHPALSASLGFTAKPPSMEVAFAAMRQASNYKMLIKAMQSTLDLGNVDAFRVTPKQRSQDVLFAVSDILSHRFFGPCVVVGWDKTCQADDLWIRENKICQVLKHGTEQPFYNVLLGNNPIPRYYSQENLELCRMSNSLTTRKLRSHPQAPFYFKGPACTNDNYTKNPKTVTPFVPSEALEYVYPDDVAYTKGERDFRSITKQMSVQDALLNTREIMFSD